MPIIVLQFKCRPEGTVPDQRHRNSTTSHIDTDCRAPYVSPDGTQTLRAILLFPLVLLIFWRLDTGDVLAFAVTVISARFMSCRPHIAWIAFLIWGGASSRWRHLQPLRAPLPPPTHPPTPTPLSSLDEVVEAELGGWKPHWPPVKGQGSRRKMKEANENGTEMSGAY